MEDQKLETLENTRNFVSRGVPVLIAKDKMTS